MTLRDHLREQTHLFLVETLESVDWSVDKACRRAGISQATLYRKIPRLRRSVALVRLPQLPSPRTDTGELLSFFGSPNAYFSWRRSPAELQRRLSEAKDRYLRLAKRFHPDSGGVSSEMVNLNLLWKTLEARFERKGIVL